MGDQTSSGQNQPGELLFLLIDSLHGECVSNEIWSLVFDRRVLSTGLIKSRKVARSCVTRITATSTDAQRVPTIHRIRPPVIWAFVAPEANLPRDGIPVSSYQMFVFLYSCFSCSYSVSKSVRQRSRKAMSIFVTKLFITLNVMSTIN